MVPVGDLEPIKSKVSIMRFRPRTVEEGTFIVFGLASAVKFAVDTPSIVILLSV